MDSTLTGAWIGAVAAAVLWIANVCYSTLWIERRARNRIRTMLKIEIEDNLESLQRFLQAAEQRVTFTNSQNMATMQRADGLSAEPVPMWNHRIWESLTSSIPMALSEDEIHQVYRFHAQLDELTRQKGTPRNNVGEWAKELEEVIRQISDRGNPLELAPVPKSDKLLSD